MRTCIWYFVHSLLRLPLVAGVAVLIYALIVQVGFVTRLLAEVGDIGSLTPRSLFLLYALYVLAVGVLCFFGGRWGRYVAVLASGGILVAVVGLTTWTLGFGVAIGWSLVLVIASWTVGACVLKRTSWGTLVSEGSVSFPVVLGMVIVGVFINLTGWLGITSLWSVVLPLLALATYALVGFCRVAGPGASTAVNTVNKLTRSDAIVVSIVLMTLAFVVIWSAAPETTWDALWFKARLPAVWASTGHQVSLVGDPISGVSGLSVALAVPGALLDLEASGRALQFILSLVLALSVWQFLRRESSPFALVVGALVLITPHTIWQASSANDDLFLAIAVFAGTTYLYLISRRGFQRANTICVPIRLDFLILGVFAGGIVLAKIHLIFFAFFLVILCLFEWRKLLNRRHLCMGIVWIAIASLCIGLTEFGRRMVEVGNPVFPLFNGVFQSFYFPVFNIHFDMPYTPDGGAYALVSFLFKSASETGLYLGMAPPGMMGLLVPAVVLFIAAAAFDRRFRSVGLLLLIAIALWWLQFRYLRYLFPYAVTCIALLPLLIPRRLVQLWALRSVSAFVVLPVLACLFFPSVLAQYWIIPEKLPVGVAFGQEAKADYVHRTMPDSVILDDFLRLSSPGDIAVINGPWSYQRALLPADRALTQAWVLGLRSQAAAYRESSLRDLLQDWGVRWLITNDFDPTGTQLGAEYASIIRDCGRVRAQSDGMLLFEINCS